MTTQELIDKFSPHCEHFEWTELGGTYKDEEMSKENAIRCAIVAVEERIDELVLAGHSIASYEGYDNFNHRKKQLESTLTELKAML